MRSWSHRRRRIDEVEPPSWLWGVRWVNPFQVFLLLLSLVSCVSLLNASTGSAILDESLSNLNIILWGVCLGVGSIVALIGMFTPRSRRMMGMVLERAGLFLVGGAVCVYTYTVLTNVPFQQAAYVSCIQIAYGLACGYRVYQVSVGIRWTKAFLNAVVRRNE